MDEIEAARGALDRFTDAYGLSAPPVDVAELAGSLCRLRVRRGADLCAIAGAAPGTHLSGVLLPATWEIWVRRDESETRRRFTIAHEVGHHFLHSDGVKVLCRPADVDQADDAERAKERQANRFAAELLMPEPLVREHAESAGADATATRPHVRRVADRDGLPAREPRLPRGRPAATSRPSTSAGGGRCKDRAATADILLDTYRGDRMTVALPLQLGEPVTHRGITIVPVFPLENPGAAYTTLEDALPRGLRIAETSDAGSVPELIVENPLDEHVLLYDGEELIGAKQNRILNLSVLVAAGSRTLIPVSCVEAGRWHRRSASFAAASHTAGPEIRMRKAVALGDERARPRRRPVRRVGCDRPQVRTARRRIRRPARTRTCSRRGRVRCASWQPRSRPSPASAGWRSSSPTAGPASTTSRGPTRMPATTASCCTATCSTRSSSSTGRRRRRRGPTCWSRPCLAPPAVRQPSAALGADLRIKAAGVMASGLELDGEVLQLSAYA